MTAHASTMSPRMKRALLISDVKNEDALKYYLGKKAVSRLGCFACHDIPGFETAKPIGVGLNDWGKKPAERLAFEDIGNFFKKHYYSTSRTPRVEKSVDSYRQGRQAARREKDGKKPYEKFYADALLGHHPDAEAISIRRFAIRAATISTASSPGTTAPACRSSPSPGRARPPGRTDDEFEARIFKEEAEAREAVATFILGLIAEQVPVKSINQPKGDRLAEVKGRQILDKYNCAGCHLIRPGVLRFQDRRRRGSICWTTPLSRSTS